MRELYKTNQGERNQGKVSKELRIVKGGAAGGHRFSDKENVIFLGPPPPLAREPDTRAVVSGNCSSRQTSQALYIMSSSSLVTGGLVAPSPGRRPQ